MPTESMSMADYIASEREHQLEEEIQKDIVEALTLRGRLVLEYAKSGTHGALKGSIEEGHPDLLVIKGYRAYDLDGRIWRRPPTYIWAEVKVPGKHPTKKQAALHKRLRAQGCIVYVWHSVEEALRDTGETWEIRRT